MPMGILLLLAVFTYPILIVSVFIHELGHAVVAWLTGFAVHSFGIGQARPVWVFNLRNTRVFFCWRGHSSGLTFAHPLRVFPSRRMLVAFYFGGVLANLLCAIA